MTDIKTYTGDLKVKDARYAIVAARFNSFIVDHLMQGALAELHGHGIQDKDIEIIYVPGAYELPLVAKRLATSKRYDAIIALGAVIRGGTPHFEYVAGSCAEGLLHASLQQDLPIVFGVLTVDNTEQAIERASVKELNKGGDAALTAIEMVSLLRELDI